VAHRPHGIDDAIRGSPADIHQGHSQFLLVVKEDRFAGRQLLQDDVIDLQAGPVAAADDVLGRGSRSGDDVHLGFQPHSGHPQGLHDSVLVVHDEFLGQNVQDLPVVGNGHGPRRIDDPLDIIFGDFPVFDRHHPVAVEPADVAPGDSAVNRADLRPGHQLRFLHGFADRFHGGVDVDDHPLAHSLGGMGADPDDVHPGVGHLSHNGADLGGPDVQPDDDVFFLPFFSHGGSPLFWSCPLRSSYRGCPSAAFSPKGEVLPKTPRFPEIPPAPLWSADPYP
jgi:hypothetical protein